MHIASWADMFACSDLSFLRMRAVVSGGPAGPESSSSRPCVSRACPEPVLYEELYILMAYNLPPNMDCRYYYQPLFSEGKTEAHRG